jgi:hypothetical protein
MACAIGAISVNTARPASERPRWLGRQIIRVDCSQQAWAAVTGFS